jgi:hypothetical protein
MGACAPTIIRYTLWLPTEREVREEDYTGGFSPVTECSNNQARLEYYSNNSLWGKVNPYWLASASTFTDYYYASSFRAINGPTSGTVRATVAIGVVPAFCIK